jgi:hypothetical protein
MSIIAIAGRAGSGKDTVGKIIQCLYYLHKKNINELTVLDLLNDKNLDLNLTGWQVKKFADKLKDIVCILIGCTREQLEDQDFKNTELGEEWWYYLSDDNVIYNYLDVDKKEYKDTIKSICKLIKPTSRFLLQNIGTDLFRDQLHPNIWVNSLMSEYKPTNLDENGLITAVNDYGIKVSVKPNPILFPEELIYPSWCITDMRFPNEYDAVKSRGGITIRVVREFYEFSNNDHEWGDKECRQGKLLKVNADYYSKEESNKVWRDFLKENDHQSEIALDDHQFDYEIINDAGISELIEKVKQILITEKII